MVNILEVNDVELWIVCELYLKKAVTLKDLVVARACGHGPEEGTLIGPSPLLSPCKMSWHPRSNLPGCCVLLGSHYHSLFCLECGYLLIWPSPPECLS